MTCNKKLDLAELEESLEYARDYIMGKGDNRNGIIMLFCTVNKIVSFLSKLINASEKEDKVAFDLSVGKDESVSFIRGLCSKCNMAFNGIGICNECKKEEPMKYPCGKVFDCNLEIKRADGLKVFKVVNASSENLLNLNFKLAAKFFEDSIWHYYQPCGCYSFDHKPHNLDLINVPEVKEIDFNKIKINKDGWGNIFINYHFNEKRHIELLTLTCNGVIYRNKNLPTEIGFPLDEQGRIKLED